MRNSTFNSIIIVGGLLTLITASGSTLYYHYALLPESSKTTPAITLLAVLLGLTFTLFIAFIIYHTKALATSLANERHQRYILNSIIDNASAGIYVKNTAGKYILVNKQIADNLGLSQESMMGKTLFDVVPINNATRIQLHDEEILRTGTTLQTEEHLTIHNQSRTFISTKFPVKDQLGNIIGVGGIDTDITARKEDEQKLEEAFNRINDLYNNAPCGYYSLNAEGTFIEINDTLLHWIGFSRSQLVGKKSFIDFLTAESKKLFLENFSAFLSTPGIIRQEYEMLRADGSVLWVEVSSTAECDNHGRFMYSRSNLHDITAYKKAEKQIQQLNKQLTLKIQSLEETNNELTTFTHSVSHDLRAPLRAIHSFISLIDQEYKAELTGECLTMFLNVQKNADRMSNLIDDLLAYSRVGRSGIKPAEMDMGDHARVIMNELLTTGVKNNIIFECHSTGKIICDKTLMRQVLVNLLSNAVKYSSRNPSPKIIFGKKETDGQVIFFVKDNGAGFDMRYAGKLFQMFQRLHTSREFDGTGVGLAIVQRIVQKHGGKVWAEGKVDDGATFYFSLPAKTEEQHELN
ncbi:MAG: PAS domain S-box protein [Chitinophagales bacterium]